MSERYLLHRLKRRSTVAVTVLAAAVFCACSDTSSPITPSETHLELFSGENQKGLAGRILPERVAVRVLDERGRPKAGIQVRFEVVEGGGEVKPALSISGAYGLVFAEWVLGGPEVRIQKLRAAFPGEGDSQSVVIEATALRTDETDVVVLRNASGPIRGALIVRDDPDGWLEVVQEVPATDTVIPLQPIGPMNLDVVVFPGRNPPLRKTLTWTAGIDTAVIELRPPFEVPVRFEVWEGPFEVRKAVIRKHMTGTQQVWDEEGLGIVFGEVAIVDHTEGDPEVIVEYFSACLEENLSPFIRVKYIHQFSISGYSGLACGGNLVYMGLSAANYHFLLAHEIGHLFALHHVPSGLMTASGGGSTLTDGEVFRAHFHERSALNLLFGLHPPEVRRDCPVLTSPSPCLPWDYQLPIR
jgi:hypothetical protein